MPQPPAKWSGLRFLQWKRNGTWSSECPQCHDLGHVGNDKPDRFTIFSESASKTGKDCGWCRSCGFFEFADNERRQLSQREIDEINRERARLATQERKRVATKIERLEEGAVWKHYHQQMQEAQRQLWRDAGIADPYQNWWELGYRKNLVFSRGDERHSSPALTIPFWHDSKVVNVQYRILNAMNGDKYRFTPGLPAPVYLPDKDTLPSGPTLVVEGAKKAMVSFLQLGDAYSVVGLPSKHLARAQVDVFKDSDPIVFCLDPDANADGTTERNAKLVDEKRTLIASLPDKIDDLFVMYGATASEIKSFLEVARPIGGSQHNDTRRVKAGGNRFP